MIRILNYFLGFKKETEKFLIPKCEICGGNQKFISNYKMHFSFKQWIALLTSDKIICFLGYNISNRIKNVKLTYAYFKNKHWFSCNDCKLLCVKPEFF